MPVKRSLKLDLLEGNLLDPSKTTRKKSFAAYSPTTGTCQMSPFASPAKRKEQECPVGPSNEKRRNLNNHHLPESTESETEDSDEFLMLLSEVEKSSEEIMKIMKDLNSIQALRGNRELENLIGFSSPPRSLKKELKKTEELMMKITKQKLLEKKSSELANKEVHHTDSYDFLKAILK
ncbi:centromere protein R isoform X2 [Sorex araneus]|uniref:centromere protein R isoform X2 n=1 Tax=Sorex araneus TaxID=42254 RepID=UPI00064B52D1|nr:centromere protein R isoform X2 [Sorex araneus]